MLTQETTKRTACRFDTAACRAIGAIAVVLAAGCAAHDRAHPPPNVPPALQVPAGQKLTRMLHATGVQVYQCKASAKDPSRYAWIYQEPKAELSDSSGKDVGRHYAGPTWEGDDGSKVIADVAARVDAPGKKSIQWLLMRSKSNSGKGVFAKVQSIQRLNTIGGLTPPDPCDAGHADQRTRVPYSADYYFYNGRR